MGVGLRIMVVPLVWLQVRRGTLRTEPRYPYYCQDRHGEDTSSQFNPNQIKPTSQKVGMESDRGSLRFCLNFGKIFRTAPRNRSVAAKKMRAAHFMQRAKVRS